MPELPLVRVAFAAAVLGCTGPSAADVDAMQIDAPPQVRTVEFPEVGDPEGRAIVELLGGHGPLKVHCPRVDGPEACRIGARAPQRWAQDRESLWLVCEREVVRVDVRSGAREVVYRLDIGEREIDDLRAGGGRLAISISGGASDPPEPDQPRFVMLDQEGSELWSLSRWQPRAFDIDADGSFLAFIAADFGAVTLRSLHGGASHRIEGHVLDLAFVGDYLLTVGDHGPEYRLIDPREGVVVSSFVVPRIRFTHR